MKKNSQEEKSTSIKCLIYTINTIKMMNIIF